MTKLKDLKAHLMEDAEFREEYARVDEEYALIEALVRARTAAKLTQAELARRLGTTPVRCRAAGRRPGVAVLRDPPPLRRSNRHTADRGPGSGRRLRQAGRIWKSRGSPKSSVMTRTLIALRALSIRSRSLSCS